MASRLHRLAYMLFLAMMIVAAMRFGASSSCAESSLEYLDRCSA